MIFSKTVPVVLQGEAADCGFACLAMLSQYHGLQGNIHELKATYGGSLQGTSLFELHQLATDLGFTVRGVQVENEALKELNLPAIVHWSGNHFVILESVDGDRIHIVDPGFGRSELSLEHAARYLTGYALDVVSAPPKEERTKTVANNERGPSIYDLIRSNRQAWTMLLYVAVVALVFELLSLSGPYFVSLVVDKAVTLRDPVTLKLIVYAFTGFFVAKAMLMFVQNRVQANLHFSLNTALYGAMIRHLMSLPYRFFLTRAAADVHSRVDTLEAAHAFFKSGIFQLPFSVLYAVVAVGLLFYLDTTTAFVALAIIAVTVAVEWPAQIMLEGHQRNRVQAGINEAKAFVSTLLRIDQVKLNNSERIEQAEIVERQSERIEASRRLEIASNDVSSIVETLQLLEKLIIVYLLATKCIEGKLSVGLAMAFLMFADEIKMRLMTMVRVWSAYRSTTVQMSRLHEICITQPEFQKNSALLESGLAKQAAYNIVLRNGSFSYQRLGEPTLDGISLDIPYGAKVVLTGSSGSGKSTLLRVISTLLPLTDGQMYINGSLCDDSSKQQLRSAAGGIFADDRLYEGTILTNLVRDIPVWNEADLDAILEVTGLKQALGDLDSGLNTLIMGEGRGVSSGQAQRILLSRALLRAPDVLLLDEPTSHCDADSTQRIVKYLSSYPGTVVVCTHDPIFCRLFSTSYHLERGRISS